MLSRDGMVAESVRGTTDVVPPAGCGSGRLSPEEPASRSGWMAYV
jgi:hypothetical protein